MNYCRKRSGRTARVLLLTLLVLILAFGVYTAVYAHAGAAAQQALLSDAVRVERTDYGWLFDGPAEDAALIFYPGGKVEETAYAPLLHRLAADCVDVCLVKMPFRLAFFGANAADGVMAEYHYSRWYIGGHSLGAIAASYAASHRLDGVILLAAYPTQPLDEPVLLLYGSEDGVLNRERVAAAPRFGRVDIQVIDGGNHALFGDYGAQRGDGSARITAEEQQTAACEAVRRFLTD